MSYTKGKVSRVSIKEPKEGQYGKFAKYGIEVNGEWYNGLCNEDKKSGKIEVKDATYNKIEEGTEVEFMFEKDQYGNQIDKKTLKVIGSAAPKEKVATLPQSGVKSDKQTSSFLWISCLMSSIKTSQELTLLKEGEEVKLSTKNVIDIANIYFEKATSMSSEIHATMWIPCLDCAILSAKGHVFEVVGDAANYISEQMIKMADVFLQKAKEK